MARPKTTMKLVRVQLDLPEEIVRAIDGLAAEARIPTRKEMFYEALRMLTWAADQVHRGRTIASIDENTLQYKEFTTHILSALEESSLLRKLMLPPETRELADRMVKETTRR